MRLLNKIKQYREYKSGVKQCTFNPEGPDVAAVGACGSLITLMVSLFTGLAAGANVLIAKRVGQNDQNGIKTAVGTSLTIGLLSGFFLMAVSFLFARDFLVLMNCQPDVLEQATLYLKIYFLGAPIFMARFDPENLCLVKATEVILVPELGARLGNFTVTDISDREIWLLTAEWMQPIGCEKYGSDNSVWIAKLRFE